MGKIRQMELPIKILIIDDDQDILNIYGRMLTQEGHQVSTASTAAEGFSALSEFRPDVVLLDVMLPDMNGVAVLKQIKSGAEYRNIYVILMSGYEKIQQKKSSALEIGADDFLFKPVPRKELLHRIQVMIRLKSTENELRKAKQALEVKVKKQLEQLKRTNKILEKSEKHLITANEIAHIGSFDHKLANPDFNCSYGLYHIFGYEPKEVHFTMDMIKSRIHSRDQDRFDTDYQTFLNDNKPIDKEYKIIRKDGSERDVRFITKTEFNTENNPVQMFGLFQDITEKKIMERQMMQNEKLASLGFLVSGVAHEINNPNNFITFNMPILEDYIKQIIPIVDEYAARQEDFSVFNMSYDEFREDIFKLMGNVIHGANRINKIVANLREFVHTKNKVASEWVELNKVIHKCIQICKGKINKLVTVFNVSVEKNLPLLFIDPEIIEIVMINLLINAAQACDKKDSSVTVNVRSDPSCPNGIIIEVRDNGCGMDKETKSKIFDPFFTTKASNQGTGIGLSLCHNLLESLSGRIEVESEKGKGSLFRVIVPSQDLVKAAD